MTDLDRAFVVDLLSGAKEVDLPAKECMVALGSQAAWYTFAMRFGLQLWGSRGDIRSIIRSLRSPC